MELILAAGLIGLALFSLWESYETRRILRLLSEAGVLYSKAGLELSARVRLLEEKVNHGQE